MALEPVIQMYCKMYCKIHKRVFACSVNNNQDLFGVIFLEGRSYGKNVTEPILTTKLL